MKVMTDHFESKKNVKATAYTLAIGILLLMIFLFVTWTLPAIPSPVTEEGIEVNLGNSDKGLGNDQPFLPGEPSAKDQEKYNAPKQAVAEKANYKDVETDDKQEDAPVVKKPPVTKPDATRILQKDVAKSKPVKTVAKPVQDPVPVKPKPKAVFSGVSGTGSGGNDADHFKAGGNQGIAGGQGDQGRPGGDPNATSYTGGGKGNSGVTISRGLQGRNWIKLPSFTDDFNENAKVAVDIRVDENGNVTEASYQPRGSTTSDSNMKEIALRKAKMIKFNTTGDESSGTIIFNFKVKN